MRSSRGSREQFPRSDRSALCGQLSARSLLRLCLLECRCRDLDELCDLVFGEPCEAAEVASKVYRILVTLAAETAEAEQLVDGLLIIECFLLTLRILGG